MLDTRPTTVQQAKMKKKRKIYLFILFRGQRLCCVQQHTIGQTKLLSIETNESGRPHYDRIHVLSVVVVTFIIIIILVSQSFEYIVYAQRAQV